MRGLVTDYHEDGTFDSDITRNVDDIYSKDAGKLSGNVVSESNKWFSFFKKYNIIDFKFFLPFLIVLTQINIIVKDDLA